MASQGTPTYKVTGLQLGFIEGSESTIYASWNKFSHKHFDKYETKWSYTTSTESMTNVWFEGSSSSIDSASTVTAQYDPPANATKVKFSIKAVSKEKSTSKKKKTNNKYFNSEWVHATITPKDAPRARTPDAPEVTISGTTVTATISGYSSSGYEAQTTDIEFLFVMNDTDVYGNTITSGLIEGVGYSSASIENVPRGASFKAQCRAKALSGWGNLRRTIYSSWSSFSSNVKSGPGDVQGKPTGKCLTESSAEISWNEASNVFVYEVQYVPDDKNYFDTAPDKIVSSKPDAENHSTTRIISGLENTEGKKYYFRVRACGQEGSENGKWSEISDAIIVGTVPDVPTTWSYVSSCKIQEGGTVRLNWAHNSADGSKQTAAQIDISINEVHSDTITIVDDTSFYDYPTENLNDSDEVSWKVRTRGAINTGGDQDDGYSDWSSVRSFKAYTPPEILWGLYENVIWYWDYLDFENGTIYETDGEGEDQITEVTKFPFVLNAKASPNTQNAISFSVSIVSNSSYDTLDETGSGKHVSEGDEIYSMVFTPTENAMTKVFRPYDIDLEDGVTYTLIISVSMDSGLDAEVTATFDVHWEDEFYTPNIEYNIDEDNYACYIRPFVVDDEDNEITSAYLSVYRREYDGRFTPVIENLDGELRTTITDPHPSLDYARYRVVAMDKTTGAITYDDIGAIEVGCNSIIIQWDDAWSDFNDEAGPFDERMELPSQSSMIKLPYNIDVTVDNTPDVALVEYIGRESPVSYYGTQRGESTRWSTEIAKNDKEMLYSIRRLAAYMGDVYVREPSGIGYWANIRVSYNLQHSKATIPVTFTITRVEGGV